MKTVLLGKLLVTLAALTSHTAWSCEPLLNDAIHENLIPENAAYTKEQLQEVTVLYQAGPAAEAINFSLRKATYHQVPGLEGMPEALAGTAYFTPKIVRAQVKMMDTAFERSTAYDWNPAAKQDMLTFRGSDYVPTKNSPDGGYVSTTRKTEFAEQMGHPFAVFIPKGTNTLEFTRIDRRSEGFGQAEVVLPRGTHFEPIMRSALPQAMRSQVPEGMKIYKAVVDRQPSRLPFVQPEVIDGFKQLNKNATAKEIMELLSRDPFIAEMMSRDAGVWEGMTIGEHTTTVAANLEKLSTSDFAGKLNADQLQLLRLITILHDIGKPLAIVAGDKERQHEFNSPIIKQFFKGLGLPKEMQKLGEAVVENGWYRQLMEGQLSLQETIALIERQASAAGVSPKDFYLMSRMLFTADVGSYELLRHQLMEPGTLRFTNTNLKQLDQHFN